MSGVDISVLCTLLVFAVVGGWKGFSWQATHLASVVLGFSLATAGAPGLAGVIGEPNPFGRCLAWLGIFILVVLLGVFLAYRLREKITEYKLSTYDREFGAVLGILKGGLLVSVVLFFLVVPRTPMRVKVLEKSKVGAPFALVLEGFHRYIPVDLHREVHPPRRPGGPRHWGVQEPTPERPTDNK